MSFLFFIKPSQLTVDCFTTNEIVYQTAKIEPAVKFVPNWWKQLPKSYGEHPYIQTGTLKKCLGFLDLYKSGFIMPMWCDFAVDIGPIGSNYYKYQYADFLSVANEHPENQKGTFCTPTNYQHLKLNSHWFLKTNKNLNWLFMDVIWNDVNLPPYRVLTGVLNFKYDNSTNVNVIFKRQEKEQQIFIPYKTPLVHLIPMTEKFIKLNYELVDEQTLSKNILSVKQAKIKFVGDGFKYRSELRCPIKHN